MAWTGDIDSKHLPIAYRSCPFFEVLLIPRAALRLDSRQYFLIGWWAMPSCIKVGMNRAQSLKHYVKRASLQARINHYIDFCALWKLDWLCQAHSVVRGQYTLSYKSRHIRIVPPY